MIMNKFWWIFPAVLSLQHYTTQTRPESPDSCNRGSPFLHFTWLGCQWTQDSISKQWNAYTRTATQATLSTTCNSWPSNSPQSRSCKKKYGYVFQLLIIQRSVQNARYFRILKQTGGGGMSPNNLLFDM